MGRSNPQIGLMHARRQRFKRKKIDPRFPNGRVVKYFERNDILKEMGFATYKDYLQSDLWKAIRTDLFKKNRVCSLCDGVASEVHHSDYSRDTLEGVNQEGLTPICRTCHELVETFPSGDKRLGKSAQRQYDKLMKTKLRKIQQENRAERTRQKKLRKEAARAIRQTTAEQPLVGDFI